MLASEEGSHALERPAVLLVADLQPLSRTGRFRIVLSDGVQSVQGMLPTSMNHLVEDGELRRGTVLCLLEYLCSTLQNRRIFMFTEFEILQTDCMVTEHREGQRIEANRVRKTIAQINAGNLVCLEAIQPVVVKATLTLINKKNICYTSCPLVVDGMQCCMEVSRNEDGWWHCHSCNHTLSACDYMYRIYLEIKDSIGSTYAYAPQRAGQDIFGCTAKELYLMKYEQQDSTQFDNIVEGVLFRDFLFEIMLQSGATHDMTFLKWTILRAEKVNFSTENRLILREINKLKESSDNTAACQTVVGSRMSNSWRVQN